VIVSYQGRRTAAYAAGKCIRALAGVERPARLVLDRLEAAQTLHDVSALQSNRLETLDGERNGQHAIRVNDQWRVCFEWPETSSGPTHVELVESDSGGHMAAVAIHPGEHLLEELRALNMSASELARRIKVPTNRVTRDSERPARDYRRYRVAPRALFRNQRRVLAEPSKLA